MSEKILVEQGTDEWHQLRQESIGASDCPVILGIDPFTTPKQLWREKILGSKRPSNRFMEEGKALEPIARGMYEQLVGERFFPAVYRNPHRRWMIASLDGISEDGTILEIKSVGDQRLREMEELPEHWIFQGLHQMFVLGAERVIFYVIARETHRHGIFDVEYDEDKVLRLLQAEQHFHDFNMLRWEEPDAVNDDFEVRTDAEWLLLSRRYLELEGLDKEREEVRERLIDLTGGQNCEGGGIRVSKHWSKGAVDYKKIPELNGKDLEPYRKRGYERWRIS